jgi:predicted O-methyltransferase YrrM
MSKLAVLKALLANPKEVITQGYMAMARKKAEVNYEKIVADKYGINQFPTIDLLDLLPGLHETINYYSFLTDTSLITDIVMLKALAKRAGDCSYMEIGSFRGESITAVADVAKDCTSLTLSVDEMRAFNFDENHIKASGVYIKDRKNITSHYHNSLTFDFSKLNKKFDLIFVDGDHTHDAVVSDTRNVFKLLKDEISIIVWHDYAYYPGAVRHEVMSAILEGTPKEFHNNLYHVSNTMCAIFTREKVNAKRIGAQIVPNKVFKVEIEARKFEI